MRADYRGRISYCMAVVLLLLAPLSELTAHGGGNWDPFTIDGVNDDAHGRLLEVQGLMSEVIRGRVGGDEWPLAEFKQLRDALITVKEEVDEVLEHYVLDGVNIQVAPELRAKPRAGRSAAASAGLNAGIAVIDHAISLESADAFVQEFYAAGLASRLYELLGAHLDRMELYVVLTVEAE